MSTGWEQYFISRNEQEVVKSASHEAGHAVSARCLEDGVRFFATIDGNGCGIANIRFAPTTGRSTMFRIGVAGVLAEAKFDEKQEISLTKADLARTAREIYEYVTGQRAVGEKGEFLVLVYFQDGTNGRYLSNLDDFHFVRGEIAKRTFTFKQMLHADGIEKSLLDAVKWVATQFRDEATWKQVCDATDELIEKRVLVV